MVLIVSLVIGIAFGVWLSVRYRIRSLVNFLAKCRVFLLFLKSNKSIAKVTGPPGDECQVPELPPVIAKKGFRLKKKVASGGFATIYLASWTDRPNKDIAAKIIKLSQVSNYWVEKNLKNELKIHRSLIHENVVRVFEVVKTTTSAYIFMEFAHKGSVADILEKTKQPMKEKVAKKYMKDIAKGLCHIHSKDIGHRDIKPDNFLIDSTDKAMLGDFGFACKSDGQNKLLKGTACGTDQYKALEIKTLEEGKVYDPKAADMYSYAISLYLMVYFDFPFDSKNEKQCIKQQKEKTFRFRDDVQKTSNAFKNLMNLLLEPLPDKRITSIQTLRHEWFETQ